MKCTLCGKIYSLKTYRCPKCFPALKKKETEQPKEEAQKVTDALNQGQLAMVYGEEEK